MIRYIVPLALFALAVPLAASAQGWRYTSWGMKPMELVAASRGEVRSAAPLLDTAPNRQEMRGETRVEGAPFNAVFGFTHGGLSDVALVPVSNEICPRLKSDIVAARGAPKVVKSGQQTSFQWRDDVSASVITLTEIGDDDYGCRVLFRGVG